jgi:hypothetical protein
MLTLNLEAFILVVMFNFAVILKLARRDADGSQSANPHLCQSILKQFILRSQNHVNLHSINPLPYTFAFALASAYEFPVLKFVGTQTSNALALPEGLTFLPQLPRFRRASETYQHPSLPLPEVPANQNQNQTGWQITHSPFRTRNLHPFLSLSFRDPTKPT